ncbi:hypothetical protein FHU10_3764 [Serratia fonticola]|uniref:Uncharacterized protein n=1 Tax=Serratia fonticola TaxID=47917 RepID=A0A542D0X1_SERFO|nr:hypothetical protein [Serratia fonticola]TQI81326.1 hypothetical protein FHU09_3943 [Serratia fonticola]TQI96650.1 hypothetical protein FHU11_2103 [Serratia fonticola]TVZ71147.1 hypothetical protein FHU10_3764 [Serratia fonticola]
MKQCIEKIRHDDPSCKSSSGKSLQVWLNEEQNGRKHFSGYCFSCSKLVPDPYGNNPPDTENIKTKTPEEIQEEMDDIKSCGYINTNHRSISPEWWKFYGVRQLYYEFDGVTPNAIAHPFTLNGVVTRWVVKLMNKKVMWSVGDTQNNFKCSTYGDSCASQ